MGLVRVGGMFAGILLCRSVLCDIVVVSGQRLAVGFEVLKWWVGLLVREGLIRLEMANRPTLGAFFQSCCHSSCTCNTFVSS